MTNTDAVLTLEIAGQQVEVIRKKIKNLHVGVYPPEGHVRVAAPPSVSLDAIRHAVLTRLAWVKRKQREFRRQARETPREFVSGETHYVFGRPCRLEVRKDTARPKIELTPGGRLLMRCKPDADLQARSEQMSRWYRRMLRKKTAPRVEKWAKRLGVEQSDWGIRRMKTKWGSCNPKQGKIWINLELAKKPSPCLDYVILHEMTHFISPRHDELFLATLEQHMPGWRQVRSDLNAFPLAHEPSFENYTGK
ncbi:M48 family metallopeptidase [Ruegeria arenilitoris]|uniref:M48 family metallopeptidase n=1 Tax=Ruegeria arenilitoris TaxID=1173585 RepID=UPI00147E76A3|nr:SprT family zinc-dependent metalloprotease [Ruegeria arenilitoris]